MKAVRIHQRGGPEVLQLDEIEQPQPGPGQVLIRVEAAGINYADIGQRSGAYPNPMPLPLVLGFEAAGHVAALGAGVNHLAVGQRVVSYVQGGYAEYAVAPAEAVMPLPPHIELAVATALPIQGQTAYLLLAKATRLAAGESVLVHVAAGGVGSLAVQVARALGAKTVIGSTRTPEKMELIRELGAIPVNTSSPAWVEEVMAATEGQGVDVVLDCVGGALAQQSIACMAPFGRMAVYGSLSGAPTMIAAPQLIRNCLSVGGFNTPAYPPQAQMEAGRALVGYLAAGQLRVITDHRFPLAEVAAAHRAIEAGETTGKVVLTV